jgi:hypothetical protein
MMMRDQTLFPFLAKLFANIPSKVKICPEIKKSRVYGSGFSVPFNPSSLSTSSSVGWKTNKVASTTRPQTYVLSFPGGESSPATLSFDLLLDAYEGPPDNSFFSIPNPTALHTFSTRSAESVLPQVEAISKLQLVAPQLHRPPLCKVWWGMILLVEGPLTSLSQSFTRFRPDGTPVRAKLSCTFTDAGLQPGELFSNDVQKTHTVSLGETLQSIAARHYGDPSRWRLIAEANDIDDPRAVAPGALLVIPAVR